MYMSDVFFFFNDPAPTEIYTLSLHDALPIFRWSVIASWTGRTVHPLMQFHRIADLPNLYFPPRRRAVIGHGLSPRVRVQRRSRTYCRSRSSAAVRLLKAASTARGRGA